MYGRGEDPTYFFCSFFSHNRTLFYIFTIYMYLLYLRLCSTCRGRPISDPTPTFFFSFFFYKRAPRITSIRKLAGANNPLDTTTAGSVYNQGCDLPINALLRSGPALCSNQRAISTGARGLCAEPRGWTLTMHGFLSEVEWSGLPPVFEPAPGTANS